MDEKLPLSRAAAVVQVLQLVHNPAEPQFAEDVLQGPLIGGGLLGGEAHQHARALGIGGILGEAGRRLFGDAGDLAQHAPDRRREGRGEGL